MKKKIYRTHLSVYGLFDLHRRIFTALKNLKHTPKKDCMVKKNLNPEYMTKLSVI